MDKVSKMIQKAGDYETYLKTMISFIQKAGEIGGYQMANEEGTYKNTFVYSNLETCFFRNLTIFYITVCYIKNGYIYLFSSFILFFFFLFWFVWFLFPFVLLSIFFVFFLLQIDVFVFFLQYRVFLIFLQQFQ